MEYTGYQVFLMIEHAKLAGIIENNIEYDTTWNLGESLYNEFKNSVFDDANQPEIECIEKFLSNYNKEQFEKFISTCEEVEKYTTQEYAEKQLAKGLCVLKLNNIRYWVEAHLFTITNDGLIKLNIGNGKTQILTDW